MADGGYRQGQALDLAQSVATTSASLKSLGLPASLRKHIPMTTPKMPGAPPSGLVHRSQSLHQRGQSVVSPQDLLLRKGSDNKRKRSSWDGGVF
ncbi:hypothetical protein HGRIS_007119 [Hohenbuehelia grisea]|uniref:Uncharacterized protein n=1 Tax=Hohenbuehelia grisea TaxID=104357 RepID=A0ABR3JC89_9AGAR